MFLGIPLGFGVTREDALFHRFHKAPASLLFHFMHLSGEHASLATKVGIFQTYVSGRWLWAWLSVFHIVKLLKSVDTMCNTLLLSLRPVPAGGLLDWVSTGVSSTSN